MKPTVYHYSFSWLQGVLVGMFLVQLLIPPSAEAAVSNACKRTASSLILACKADAKDNYHTNRAICLNITADEERRQCFKDASITRREDNAECREVRAERRDLCSVIGNEPYDPPFGEEFASNFVDPLQIGGSVTPNPYLPLIPGSEWVYQSTFLDEEGATVVENIVVTVTERTKEIEGITCIEVNDIVDEDGSVIEDTRDWYAQDLTGNVWYCGEIALNFESFENDDPMEPEIVDIDGSWKSGRDGARAGIQMPAAPEIGTIIRQEIAWREAEDVIEILSLTGNETTPGAICSETCLITRDFTPLEPGINETKYHAHGVGFILEIDPEGNRLELISHTVPAP